MRVDFLRAISAAPGDDQIKQVFADFLEEQGQSESANWWRYSHDAREFYTDVATEYDYDDGMGDGGKGGRYSGDGRGLGSGYGDGDGGGIGYGDIDGNGHSPRNHGDGGGVDYRVCFGDGDGHSFAESREILMQGKYILVCDHSWVLVGDVEPHPTDHLCVVVNGCRRIRRWGTNAGLGQLAREGPQSETILDEEGDGVILQRRTVLRAIPCNVTAWRNV